ncbi:acetylornithine deacetylase [Shouchella lehensis]|uniref:Acetylornithine deacetylase n=1 Tax=Shouchella lehensis TaxID=300825 RepID=A0A4Y7WMD4_9BACI|nr:acetylornithine deacetylase [Shouchella lehensis]MBG9782937.1 acetylornithine deacetylase [Shouchella lehensis]TES49708.1 acetylornithine deacetylase [Shouchella lehensis]
MNELMDQVDMREDELIELVKALISFQTPAPPARNTVAIQTYIANYLKEMGMSIDQWDVYEGDPNVVGTLKGTDREAFQSLILNGHVDVAAVEEDEEWDTSPFTAEVKDRSIYGRGAADMKGGLAACLFALKLAYDHGIELKGDVILQSVIGEEVGEAGTKQCCERGYKADYAIVADTSHCSIQGQGGVITGWITIKSPTTHHDGTRRQLIHAGGGVNGASAIEKMAKLITALQELERHWAITKSYPGFPSGTNTINPAVIEGGRHPAFIADECRLWITVHFYPNESIEEVTKEIETHLLAVAKGDVWLRDHLPQFDWGGESMIVDRGEVFPAFSVDEKHPGFSVVSEAHEAVFKEQPKVDMSPTVTDGGWLAAYGIPTILYGPGTLANAHAVNEKIDIDELIMYTKSLLSFMVRWCNTQKK